MTVVVVWPYDHTPSAEEWFVWIDGPSPPDMRRVILWASETSRLSPLESQVLLERRILETLGLTDESEVQFCRYIVP